MRLSSAWLSARCPACDRTRPRRRAGRPRGTSAAVLFSDDIGDADIGDVLMVFEDAPSSELALAPEGMPLMDLLATVKLTSSKSEAARLVKSGGVYVNNMRDTDQRRRLTRADAIRGELFILRRAQGASHRPTATEELTLKAQIPSPTASHRRGSPRCRTANVRSHIFSGFEA